MSFCYRHVAGYGFLGREVFRSSRHVVTSDDGGTPYGPPSHGTRRTQLVGLDQEL